MLPASLLMTVGLLCVELKCQFRGPLRNNLYFLSIYLRPFMPLLKQKKSNLFIGDGLVGAIWSGNKNGDEDRGKFLMDVRC